MHTPKWAIWFENIVAVIGFLLIFTIVSAVTWHYLLKWLGL